MIDCRVDVGVAGTWIVSFENERSLLLSMDWDRAAFAVHSGTLRASRDWTGEPDLLPSWHNFDPVEITRCPEEYADLAE